MKERISDLYREVKLREPGLLENKKNEKSNLDVIPRFLSNHSCKGLSRNLCSIDKKGYNHGQLRNLPKFFLQEKERHSCLCVLP